MSEPTQEYLEQALQNFETFLKTQPTRMARITHAERLIGARLFVDFLLGRASLDPFGEKQKPPASSK